jgi:CRP/FNR family transcriptional regulator, cyclic AMP receptor protein
VTTVAGTDLAAHPFFGGLPAELLTRLARLARPTEFPAEGWLGREGEPAQAFHALTVGMVALEVHAPDRRASVLETIGAGEVVGWSWLIPPYRWHFDVRAVTPVRALTVDAKRLREEMDADSELAVVLLRRFIPVVVDRLQATRLRLLDLYGNVHD